jgi:hypothetical protein
MQKNGSAVDLERQTSKRGLRYKLVDEGAKPTPQGTDEPYSEGRRVHLGVVVALDNGSDL